MTNVIPFEPVSKGLYKTIVKCYNRFSGKTAREEFKETLRTTLIATGKQYNNTLEDVARKIELNTERTDVNTKITKKHYDLLEKSDNMLEKRIERIETRLGGIETYLNGGYKKHNKKYQKTNK